MRASIIITIKENFPTRILATFKDKKGQIALDQLRAIDRSRIVQKLGIIETEAQMKVLNLLAILFQK